PWIRAGDEQPAYAAVVVAEDVLLHVEHGRVPDEVVAVENSPLSLSMASGKCNPRRPAPAPRGRDKGGYGARLTPALPPRAADRPQADASHRVHGHAQQGAGFDPGVAPAGPADLRPARGPRRLERIYEGRGRRSPGVRDRPAARPGSPWSWSWSSPWSPPWSW